jgi:hypothetical protein
VAGFRELKPKIEDILRAPDFASRLAEFDAFPPRQAVGALFSFLLPREQLVKWRAVTAFGRVMDRLFARNPESARQVMRQMLWRMNEESGSIGWGVPEAMGEIMAVNRRLAEEYARLLVSYIREYKGRGCGDNFLDHPPLRWGVYWGLGRLAQAWPELAAEAGPELLSVLDPDLAMEGREGTYEGLTCHDAQARGLAAWVLGLLAAPGAEAALADRLDDQGAATLFRDGVIEETTVSALATEALKRIAKARTAG